MESYFLVFWVVCWEGAAYDMPLGRASGREREGHYVESPAGAAAGIKGVVAIGAGRSSAVCLFITRACRAGLLRHSLYI
eukprot:COSAG05_NODE_20122_length_283_cov_0.184783_1_plen_78_part_01